MFLHDFKMVFVHLSMHVIPTTQPPFSWTNVRLKFLPLSPLPLYADLCRVLWQHAIEEQTDCGLSSVLTLPFLRCLCHHWTILLSSVAFSQTSFNKVWMTGTVLARKVLILMYAHCSDFVMWAENFFASSSDNSHITKYQRNNYKNYHIIFCNSSDYTVCPINFKTVLRKLTKKIPKNSKQIFLFIVISSNCNHWGI